ncbi:MAG: hypothetical protein CUN56_00645 [Phototrophicales bacterium]|nr:MAG: hypothetical protein CUN56_00645 [Phototrophicales bacterium]
MLGWRMSDKIESMIEELKAHGYAVLRPLTRLPKIETPLETKVGVVIDIETTGLDPQGDEIIQLAMSFFRYLPETGEIVEVPYVYTSYNEPQFNEISDEIQMITGITPDMVKGHRLDIAHIEKCMSKVSLCVAHNAYFDRRFMERLSPVFANKPWACSMHDINWLSHGFAVKNLFYILTRMGYDMSGVHNAEFDTMAVLTALNARTAAGHTYFKELLDHARKSSVRIYVLNTRYEDNEKLRARKYVWSDGVKSGLYKGYRLDIDNSDQWKAEMDFHQELGLHPDQVVVEKITALNRYSARV